MAVQAFDAEQLKKWTTASLVIHLAVFASMRSPDDVLKSNATLVGAELNARIPPRVMPVDGT